jgi:hypothetical protein
MPPSPPVRKPSTSTSSSASTIPLTTLALFLLLLVALFPSLFHYVWTIPLALFSPSSNTNSYTSPPARYGYGYNTGTRTMWFQKTFTLPSKSRGSYLITDTVLKELPELKGYKVGILNLFVQHTSCALSLNENWDEDVREDMSDALVGTPPYSLLLNDLT